MFRHQVKYALIAVQALGLQAGSVFASEAGLVSAKAEVVDSVQAPKLTLSRRAGRYELTEAAKVQIKVSLSSAVAADETAVRIVASTFELKDAHTATAASVAAGLEDGQAVATLTSAPFISFVVEPGGALAQNAAAACAAKSGDQPAAQSSEATTTAVAVWRLTTGRFNFRWMDYDRVAVARDKAEFYTDRETLTRNIDIPLSLECRNDEPKSPVAQTTEPQKDIKLDAKPDAKTEAKAGDGVVGKAEVKSEPKANEKLETEPKTAAAAPVSKPAKAPALAPAATAAKLTADPLGSDVSPAKFADDNVKASVATPAQKPVCSGGMIRETSAEAGSFICLCPGNTQRVDAGPNSFACRKADRR